MSINIRPYRRRRDRPIDTQVRIDTNTRRQTSTSEISLDRPNMVPAEADKMDIAPYLISMSSYSRRKTTLSPTMCWLSMSPSRRQLDRLSQILYLCDSDEYRATSATTNRSRAITYQIRGPNLYIPLHTSLLLQSRIYLGTNDLHNMQIS